jgi:hypothetical protein
MESKRKGGAEREREKKRRLLEMEAGKCKKISDLFSPPSASLVATAGSSASHTAQILQRLCILCVSSATKIQFVFSRVLKHLLDI